MEENKMNSRNKLGRLNVLDIIIIVFLIFAISLAVIFTVPKFRTAVQSENKATIQYTVVFYNVDETVYDKIEVGVNVTDNIGGISLGIVEDTPESEISYKYILVTDPETKEIQAQRKDDELGRHNVTVTVVATANYSEGTGYAVDGYGISVGKEMNLRFPDFSAVGYCNSLTVVSES